jgi:hypothetical protein
MKILSRLFIILLIVASQINLQAQNIDTINIDFGSGTNTTPGNWNNISGTSTGELNEMITSSGGYSGMNVSVTDAFNGINTNGLAAAESLEIPLSGSSDSFYGNTAAFSGVVETSGGVTFTNLYTSLP